MLLQLSQFSPFAPLHPVPPILSSNPPHLSSCLWVMHVSSLASPFSILFLTSLCLFFTYLFVLLNPYTLSSILLLPLPTGNHLNDLHIYDSVSVLLVCLVCFLDSIFDCCEFIAILMCIVLIFFFFSKSL